MNMRATNIIVSTFIFCVLGQLAQADHLPESKIARGKADSVLSGVDVYRTTARKALAMLGDPCSSKVIPTTNDIVGGKEYQWKIANVSLELITWNDKGDDSIPYSVEVEGSKPKGSIGVTGRGLRLGDRFTDLLRIYGSKMSKSRRDDGTLQVIIQWSDDTTLYVYFNKAGQVDRLHLMAAIE